MVSALFTRVSPKEVGMASKANDRNRTKFLLDEKDIPTKWYNIQADLKTPAPPVLHPATKNPIGPQDLAPLFPMELIKQEVSQQRWIEIPDEIRDVYRLWRPSPLYRARRLEKALGTPAHIYYKYEGVSPAGSHKPNTAVAQAYYNKKEKVTRLSTETGAGQWGSALSLACQMFGLQCKVYMVKVSYQQKPYRRIMMETWGAQVVASPSTDTQSGKKVLEQDPNSPGSLGIAISEAVEDAATRDDTKYSLGSVLNHVLMHQTIIGQEAKKQLEKADDAADIVIGCAGGGSNFAGLSFPFAADKLTGKNKKVRIIAVEPAACPSLTKGKYVYDFGDTVGLTPLVKMHTLGHTFIPAPLHAGGLRYHGMAPLVCKLYDEGVIEATAVPQLATFEAALLFARTEGIIPAPESAHAIRVANDALGLVSLEAMGAGRWWFLALWRSAPGTLALYGAITAHGLLALWLLYDRRTLRMPPWEATQYAIGLLLPALLVVHVVSTRIAWWRFGVDDPYQRIVLGLSLQSPEFGARQTLTLVLAWLHACIGVHYWLRFRSWYPRALPWLFTVALLLPTLALLGFVVAGREVAALARTPGWTEAMLRSVHAAGPAEAARLVAIRRGFLDTYLIALVVVFTARGGRRLLERRRSIRIAYPNGRVVIAPGGFTILEASRLAGIPHASVCGGRGRCSTCRVRIVGELEGLPPPREAERRVLARVGAAPDVRLACQTRPAGDVAVEPLLAPSVVPAEAFGTDVRQGREQELAVLFADLRGFTRMAENKLPYDVVFFLNRYFEAVGTAITGAGGVTTH